MKKQILKTIVTVGLICSSNLLADTLAPTLQEYKEIVDSFKLVDTSEKELSRTYKINGEKIKAELQKQDKYEECYKYQDEYDEYKKCYDNKKKEDEQFQWVQHIITKYKPYETTLGEPKNWTTIDKYDQKILFVSCIAPNKKKVVASLVRSSTYYKKTKERFVRYVGFVAGVDKDTCCGNYADIGDDGLFTEAQSAGAETQIPNYNPKEFYPYFNEQRILERLYETNTCDKELTEKANIEVFVNGKWVSQEQSWNIKNIDYVIKSEKQYLYKEPNKNTKTKMYLVKNDVVEILEEKDDWICILYITKDNKEIKAWIPKNALEFRG